MRKEDSAKFWLPKIQETWLHTEIPDTVLVDYNESELAPSFNGQDTNMATAGNSFHDPSCLYASLDQENKL